MADFLMTRARRLFQYVNLHGTTMPPDVSTNNNGESHFRNGMSSSSVRITANDSGSHLVGENLHNNLNGASLHYSSSSPNGSITNVNKLIRQKKQKRCIMFGTIICGLAALIVIALVWKQESGNKKRAAILQRLAGGPQAESFSSATASIKGNHKRTVQLHETVYGYLTPSKFNGTWISDSDIMYRDDDGGISVLNLDTRKSYKLMSSNTTQSLYPKAYEMSSDKKYILIKLTSHSVFRRSSYGIYSMLQLKPNGQHMRKSFALRPSNFVPSSPDDEQSQFHIRYVKWAPTGNGLVYVDFQNNIFYRKSALARDVQLTNTGMPGVIYNGIPDWVFEEEVFEDNFALWWSPDASKLVFASFNDTLVESYVLPEYGHWNKPINGTVMQYPDYTQLHFPKVATRNPKIDLWLVDLATIDSQNTKMATEHTKIHPPVSLSINGDVHFSWVEWADPDHFAVTWMNRVQNNTVISLCGTDLSGIPMENPASCDQMQNQIYSQSVPDGWVEYKYRIKFNPNPPNPKNKDFIVITAAKHLKHHYRQLLYVAGHGKSKKFLTKVDGAEVVEILAWTKEGYIYYLSTLPNEPGSRHIFRVRSPTATRNANEQYNGDPECLTCPTHHTDETSSSIGYSTPREKSNNMAYLNREPCNYYSVKFSVSEGYYAMTCDGPGVPWTCIHKTIQPTNNDRHDKFVMVYEDNQRLERIISNYKLPSIQKMAIPVSNSDQKARVKLYYPPDFNSNIKYPMIVYVYGGPGFQVVDDTWNQHDFQSYLTGQGFIYALIDPKGSGYQGDDWRFAVNRAFGTAEVESTIEVTEYLQNKLSYVDSDRTGIWGWSYGGFLSLSTLISDTTNTFKCGASVAPVTDWTLYDTYYTERYMGLFENNIDGYNRARVFNRLNNISKYNKKYFVAHGTHDDNVHFQQSMLLSAALEEKDILFRQHAYPDQDHSIGAYQKHLYHTLTDFFKNDCFRDVTTG